MNSRNRQTLHLLVHFSLKIVENFPKTFQDHVSLFVGKDRDPDRRVAAMRRHLHARHGDKRSRRKVCLPLDKHCHNHTEVLRQLFWTGHDCLSAAAFAARSRTSPSRRLRVSSWKMTSVSPSFIFP